jgi:hypothetical protein
MALNSFEITNEGPVSRAVCDSVPQVMVIAGPNGVGKSTLLNALLELPSSELRGETDRPYFAPHRSPRGRNVNATNIVQMSEVSSRQTLSIHQQNRSGPSNLRNLFGTSIGGNLGRSDFRSEADFLPYYEVKRRLAQLKRSKQRQLEEIYEERNQVPEDFLPDFEDPFRDAVGSLLPGLTFKGVSDDGSTYTLNFENRDGTAVEFDDLSSGEKDLIAQVFIAVEHTVQHRFADRGLSDPPQDDLLILIDGPESYLHPRLQNSFINFVRNFAQSNQGDENGGRVQFVMCTHSRSIIEEAREEELYFLVFPDQTGPENNQLINAGGVRSDQIEKITNELGPALLSSGKDILLVEGKTDRNILNSLFPNLESTMDIVPMKGKDRVIQDTLNELIPELEGQGVKLYGIVDRDRDIRPREEVSNSIYFLEYKCVENLIVDEEIIYRSLRDSQVGVSELELKGIEDPEDIKEGIKNIVESDEFKRKEVDTRWTDNVNPINIKMDSFRASDFDSIDDFVESKVNSRIGDIDSEGDIYDRVNDIIEEENYDRLDGKEIVNRLSAVFDMKTHNFTLSVADKMREMDRIPEGLNDFISRVKE